jgi:hypothetical protein
MLHTRHIVGGPVSMVDDPIPAKVRDFIFRHVDSVAYLEALLLLRRSPNEEWTAARTAQRLYAGEQEIGEVLVRLREDGLVTVKNGVYRYDCATEEQCLTVHRLADVYARHLVPVTNLIHSKPRRIRQFAETFKVRKKR